MPSPYAGGTPATQYLAVFIQAFSKCFVDMTDFPTYTQRIAVSFDYPVHFTQHVFSADNPLLAETINRLDEHRRHRCAVFVDAGLADALPSLTSQIAGYFDAHAAKLELVAPLKVIQGGEAAKNGWGIVREIMSHIGKWRLDRQSFVLAVGGGAMLDMAGFAASIVHRGLRMVRIPTTSLAQGDAAVGVKTGMDEHGMKNFVGTFAPPFAVLNDFAFLESLAFEDWIGGISEAFKVAIIKDADFFEFLAKNAARFRQRCSQPMHQAIYRSAVIHLQHIASGGDPFEMGSARPLDFGHWSAHKLESMSGYRLRHGQAVAIGVAIDSYCAMCMGLLSRQQFERIIQGLLETGLPLWCEEASQRGADGTLAILDGLREFREHLGGELTVTLPRGIGGKCEVHEMNAHHVEQAVDFLRLRSQAGVHQ